MDVKIGRLEKAKEKALGKLLGEFYYDKFKENPDLIKNFIPKPLHESVGEEICEYIETRGKNRYKFAMVTINPLPNIETKEFIKKIEKASKKTIIEKAMWCYEWREKEEGLHCHMKIWIKDKQNPYEIKRKFYNTFKNLVGNKLHINMRYSNKNECFEEYIKGCKKTKDHYTEKPNHEWDIKNRNKLGLQSIYIRSNNI